MGNKKIIKSPVVIFLLGVSLLLWAGVNWWHLSGVNKDMRQAILEPTNVLAKAIDQWQIKSLVGSEVDVGTPDYERLKEQLASVISVNENFSFFYLMGQKNNGNIFFLVDSEPADSVDYSPPGQEYPEATKVLLSVFETGKMAIEGPVTDRWGTWISVLVPIKDSQTGQLLAVLGGDINAKDWNWTLLSQGIIFATLSFIFFIFIFGLYFHIVNQKREKDKLSAILHSIGDGVFVVDEKMRVIIVNEVVAQMIGYKMEEILGTTFNEKLKFISDETGKMNDNFIVKAMETKTVQKMPDHISLVDKNNKRIQVADSAAPLVNKKGEVFGCVVVFRDVSREREIDKVKTEFVSLASHQLRTPLSAVRWCAEMLLNGDAGRLSVEQSQYVEEIYRGNQRMTTLVKALLNVSRMELGTFTIEPEECNLRQIFKEVADELLPQMVKKIKLKKEFVAVPEILLLDKKLVHIILENLLSNAIKYTPSGGKIWVTVSKKNKDILMLFLIESGLIGLVGGIVGALLGLGAALFVWLFNKIK